MSYNSLALYLGIAFGPGAGEMLLDVGGYPLAWFGGAALAVVATVLALSLRETAERTPRGGPLVLIHRKALMPSLGLFTGVTAMAGFLGFVPLYTDQTLGIGGAGPVLLVFGMVVVMTRTVFARLPDRVPGFTLAAGALLATTFGLTLMWLLPGIAGLYAGAVLTALGVAFMTPAFFAAIVERVAPSERGVALGTTSLFIDSASEADRSSPAWWPGSPAMPRGSGWSDWSRWQGRSGLRTQRSTGTPRRRRAPDLGSGHRGSAASEVSHEGRR